MHSRILLARNIEAHRRLMGAAEQLGEQHDLGEHVERLKAARSRDKQVEGLLQREAITDLLEALVSKLDGGKMGEQAAKERRKPPTPQA